MEDFVDGPVFSKLRMAFKPIKVVQNVLVPPVMPQEVMGCITKQSSTRLSVVKFHRIKQHGSLFFNAQTFFSE